MNTIGFVFSDRFLDHRTPAGHAERGERLSFLVNHLHATGLWTDLDHIRPVVASREDVLRVHTEEHVESIRMRCELGGGLLDEGDTYASRDSYEVALLAAGGVCAGIDAVMEGRVNAAFCAVRPPGHHAERARPMGFCLFNNIAVGARYAQAKHGLERVAILDWDVHHGNGTQHTFEDDPSVLFISLHQYPFYPGTGSRDETGRGRGEGYTMNFPMTAGTGEDVYREAFAGAIVPALRTFKPALLMVSAGFDAHEDDPLADIRLTARSYRVMTDMIKPLAPIVSVLEGGYNLKAMAESVEAHLVGLQEEERRS